MSGNYMAPEPLCDYTPPKAAGGVEDWRVLYQGAHAYFRVTSFAEGAHGS